MHKHDGQHGTEKHVAPIFSKLQCRPFWKECSETNVPSTGDGEAEPEAGDGDATAEGEAGEGRADTEAEAGDGDGDPENEGSQ